MKSFTGLRSLFGIIINSISAPQVSWADSSAEHHSYDSICVRASFAENSRESSPWFMNFSMNYCDCSPCTAALMHRQRSPKTHPIVEPATPSQTARTTAEIESMRRRANALWLWGDTSLNSECKHKTFLLVAHRTLFFFFCSVLSRSLFYFIFNFVIEIRDERKM